MQYFYRIGRPSLILLILLSACGQESSVPGNPPGVPGQPIQPTPAPSGDANGTTPAPAAPGTSPTPTPPPSSGGNTVGYNEDVAPVFQTQCQSCHGGSGLMDNYNEAQANFGSLMSRIESGNMPKGRPALSQATKDMLNTWANEGFPQTR